MRVQAQRAAFDLIQSTEGFHVRLGSLSGKGNRKRQKKVAVLLAVEALDHAFRKNIQQVSLITGDLDCSPLVDSLVKLGTYVKVMYEPKSAARELYAAVDTAYPIGIWDVYDWSSADFQQRHPIPQSASRSLKPAGVVLKTGTSQNKLVELYEQNGTYYIYAPMWDHYSLEVKFTDPLLLERYFGMRFAPNPFSHRRGSRTLRAGRCQPLISPTLGSYFAEAGIALAKSAHVTRMKFCSFRNFLNSSLLTRSISFWRHCAPHSGWSNVAARISSLS